MGRQRSQRWVWLVGLANPGDRIVSAAHPLVGRKHNQPETSMHHTIEFRLTTSSIAEKCLPKIPGAKLDRRVRVFGRKLKPYVQESKYGPVEVADLFFEDGTPSLAASPLLL